VTTACCPLAELSPPRGAQQGLAVCALGPLAQGPRIVHESKEGAARMDEDDDSGEALAVDTDIE
jgi:hypothetical protein